LHAFSPDQEILKQTASDLQKSFELSIPFRLDNMEQLVSLLVPAIRHGLDSDFEKLLQFCYRIDLSEEKLKRILHESPPGQMAEELSRAIITRQCQKFELRRKYSG
jgi:hypothetical protein